MRVIVLGATGMVGQGVLRECLLDAGIEEILVIGRTATGRVHPKLREIVRDDLFDLSTVEDQLAGYDACFFCLGVSSAGMSEEAYRRITYDLTVSVARSLAGLNPGLRFLYVSGQGTDSTERGRMMWARVKGQTENALLAMPFEAYMLRPGYIQPMHGVRSKTRLYRMIYAVAAPIYPLIRALLPRYATTTDHIGRAMITIARSGAPKRVLETHDIAAIEGAT
jgi:uncharacterized protein YbjT (DUF2867 family)